MDANAARDVILHLKRDRWVDQATRAVSVQFNAYNTNSKLLTTVRIVFEFRNTGRVYVACLSLGLYCRAVVVMHWPVEYEYSSILYHWFTKHQKNTSHLSQCILSGYIQISRVYFTGERSRVFYSSNLKHV